MATKYILFFILILVGIAGLAFSLFYTFSSQSLPAEKRVQQQTFSENAALTSLSLVSQTQTSAAVIISPHGTLPGIVQLEIGYDPQNITNVAINAGDFFDKPTITLELIDPLTGRISYALSGTPKKLVNQETATVATLTFIPLFATAIETPLQFLPKTMIRNVEKKTLPLEVSGTILRWQPH